jgi:TonB-dependent outer membrane receptor, SusC/RagA subfamily, signature region
MASKSFFLLLVCFSISTIAYCQDLLITANWKNASIKTVKIDIERQTGYTIWDPTDADFTITLNVFKRPLSEVLTLVYRPNGYTWQIFDKSIAIKKKPPLQGVVTNTNNELLVGATIAIRGDTIARLSDSKGEFKIPYIKDTFVLVISNIGYKTQEILIKGENNITIKMEPFPKPLTEVAIEAAKTAAPPKDTTPSTIPDIKTGSEFKFDANLRNYPVIQNITDIFPAATGAVLVSPTSSPQLNQAPLTIRNRITIFGDPHPLVILDNFPYHGDINNINPTDIESISIIKDAAASTQWGIHAGNGVILITTKKGSYNTSPKVSAVANVTMGFKPNLHSLHTLSANDHTEIVKTLFREGYYHNLIQNAPYAVLPPAADILFKQERGQLSATESEKALNELRQTDIRNEAEKYLYRKSLHQQYHVGVTGGAGRHHYYYSIGYDAAKSNLAGNDNSRFTMKLNNTVQIGKSGPELYSDLYFNRSAANNNGFDINDLLFHQKLADDEGRALPIAQTLNQAFKDSITQAARLLDWNYRPLDEIKLSNNTLDKTIFMFTTGIRFKLGKKWEVNAVYRYEKDMIANKNLHSVESYFTRNIINEFTRIDSQGLYRPIPLGGILDENISKRTADNMSAMITFRAFNRGASTLTLYAGSEIRHIITNSKRLRRYGITESGPPAIIDYITRFMLSYAPGIPQRIPAVNEPMMQRDHFYSLSANGVYTWRKRLAASFTIRKDESNIFGAQANQKGIPLVSTGISWDIYPESFDNSRLFSQLRLRLSNGFCGNTSKNYSTLTGFQTTGPNIWNSPAGFITNPSNPKLAWETVRISNIALDFSLLNKKISGTAEYFVKEGSNLLGSAPIDPTGGVTIFQGNVASMKGHGVELTLNTKLSFSNLQWQGTLLASCVQDKVTRYYILAPANWYYPNPQFLNPKEGKPLYAAYSFNLVGFDPITNEPIGVLNNRESKDYDAIINSPNFSELIYHGPATPTFYGSFHNTISWKQLELGFNIIFKAGYYFSVSPLSFDQLFNGASARNSNFSHSMIQPGYDLITNIPFRQQNPQKDAFYKYSSNFVEKGDHIRLQDIKLKYTLLKNPSRPSIWPLSEFFLYANNLGLLWKANKRNMDPDYPNKMAPPVTITLGIKTSF